MPRSLPGTPLLLIAYDTSDDRLRRRLARLLEGYGDRVQYSVFECPVRPAERASLLDQLRKMLAATDAPCSVRCYYLGIDAALRAIVLGQGHLTRDASVYVL